MTSRQKTVFSTAKKKEASATTASLRKRHLALQQEQNGWCSNGQCVAQQKETFSFVSSKEADRTSSAQQQQDQQKASRCVPTAVVQGYSTYTGSGHEGGCIAHVSSHHAYQCATTTTTTTTIVAWPQTSALAQI